MAAHLTRLGKPQREEMRLRARFPPLRQRIMVDDPSLCKRCALEEAVAFADEVIGPVEHTCHSLPLAM
eukprot:3516723-Prymnesium_polylepis.2